MTSPRLGVSVSCPISYPMRGGSLNVTTRASKRPPRYHIAWISHRAVSLCFRAALCITVLWLVLVNCHWKPYLMDWTSNMHKRIRRYCQLKLPPALSLKHTFHLRLYWFRRLNNETEQKYYGISIRRLNILERFHTVPLIWSPQNQNRRTD